MPVTVAQVQAYYASVQHLAGTFTETVTNQTFGRTTTSSGKVYAEKPNHVRFDYPKRSVISDGTSLWIVDQANLQVMTGQVGQSQLPAAVAFLGNSDLAATYTITATGDRLELVPKQASTVAKLVLVVDAGDGHVTESIVTDSQGNTEDMAWSLDPKPAVKASWFTFSPSSVPSYKLVKLP